MTCHLCASEGEHNTFVSDMYELDGDVYDIVRCKRCGLLRVWPLPLDKEIEGLYAGDYFEKDYGSGLNTNTYFGSQSFLRPRYAELLNLIERHAGKGALLEIGCAGGYFLKMAEERGWVVSGVEVSSSACDFARELLPNAQLFEGSFPEGPRLFGPDKLFDVVYMGHVLEHCLDVNAALKEANDLLRPGGVLLVEVPGYVSSVFYKVLLFVNTNLFSINTDVLKLPNKCRKPYHLTEFSQKTLKMFLEKHGFEVVHLRSGIQVPESIKSKKLLVLIFKFLKFFGTLLKWQMEYLVVVGTKK